MTYIRVDSPIVLDRALLVGVKADLVKRRLRLTLETPFDEQTLALREKLANMALDPDYGRPVEVTLQQLQFQPRDFQLELFASADAEEQRQYREGMAKLDAALSEVQRRVNPDTGEITETPKEP